MKKFDDFMIDRIFQRLVNLVGISPFTLSYYFWGISVAGNCAIAVAYHAYTFMFVGFLLIFNQIQVSNLAKLKRLQANPIRYQLYGCLGRTLVFFMFVLDWPFIWFFGIKPVILIDMFWLSAIYTSCCSLPPPKEIKVNVDKMIFQN